MSTVPPPPDALTFTCPHCGQAFQVRSEYRGMQVACPHCGQAIEVPLESGAVPPPPPPLAQPLTVAPRVEETVAAPPTPPEPEPEPPRELSREEREQRRRRFRIAVAVLAGGVLLVALWLLLQVE
jgi:predicted Zn finger-like uncharacterized protein